jgi:hypothetical protein
VEMHWKSFMLWRYIVWVIHFTFWESFHSQILLSSTYFFYLSISMHES